MPKETEMILRALETCVRLLRVTKSMNFAFLLSRVQLLECEKCALPTAGIPFFIEVA
jgi:hypothetical protein